MSINWNPLDSKEQVESIVAQSAARPQVIFKHSTRCSISSIALRRLEEAAAPAGTDFHFLDLIKHRDISNHVAEKLDVWHESPQVILVKDGKVVYDESHMGIDMESLVEQL